MFFILLTFAAALFIEGLGSLVSVIGISALFGANPIIIALAISLDVGKIVVVSLLYTYWKQLSKIMKTYALVAAAVTMTITSAGAAGYLSGEFQKAILSTKEGELKVSVLKEQQAKYQERKNQIDDQIAKLPEKTTVNQRLRLMNGFKTEQKALDDKISAIDAELPGLQITQIGTEAKAGPILYIAKAFDISVEVAVKWVILMIIFVFDPLAVFLIIAGNFLVAHRKAGDKPHLTDMWEGEPDKGTPSVVPTSEVIKGYAEVDKPAVNLEAIKAELEETTPPLPVVDESFLTPDFKIEEGDSLPRVDPAPELENLVEEPQREIPVLTDEVINLPQEVPEESGLLSPVVVESPAPNRVAPREEITRSSLGLVDPDHRTIVDARARPGYSRAKSVMTVPTKK